MYTPFCGPRAIARALHIRWTELGDIVIFVPPPHTHPPHTHTHTHTHRSHFALVACPRSPPVSSHFDPGGDALPWWCTTKTFDAEAEEQLARKKQEEEARFKAQADHTVRAEAQRKEQVCGGYRNVCFYVCLKCMHPL